MNNAIDICNLTKQFGEQVVLSGVNMTVKRGEIYAFLGANGAGKTTLMKLLFGILQPDNGVVSILGETINWNGENPVFRQTGNIIEAPVYYKNLSATENLQIHCDYLGSNLRQDISSMLQLVGLDSTKDKRVGDFSLGMKQRLALARALISKPKVLILDEPINGLDPMGISDTRNLLLSVNKEMGTTMLISSHIISEIAKMAHTVGIIDQGVMLCEKPLTEIYQENNDLEDYFRQVVCGGVHHA